MAANHSLLNLNLSLTLLLILSINVNVAISTRSIRPLGEGEGETGVGDSEMECVFTVYVRTGSVIKGGTDSKMTLTLYDAAGYGVRINNLEAWGGLMGPDYDYFERGNLDIFSARVPCLTGPVCAMNLTSDGSGSGHGWYCNYVEVTSTGPHLNCAQQTFTVEQWLATDRSPYELTAIRNSCSGDADSHPSSLMPVV
ncbi:PLAT domain-containing protein 3-like isoform X2 [Andrographis paniculata]|uniref:PLAT domain-containing protein 3-like isoform X2 n=1 Tax=Andrographis paniculata TaxID=175694 RepID=UPI0021E868BD|nr:PLAT domain-containing protein 3-like isoform X2 [Andrographis paniculata]